MAMSGTLFGWLIAIVVLGILELATSQIVSIWFVFGAVASGILCGLDFTFKSQIICFVIVSATLLILFRPIVQKSMKKNELRLNADKIIGQAGNVIITVDNYVGTGQIVVNGQTWTARAVNNEIIEAGTFAVVNSISGVKAMVTPLLVTESKVESANAETTKN